MSSRTLYIGLILPVLLVGFWLRVQHLNSYPAGVSNDEAVDVVDAFHIATSLTYPWYEDFGRPDPLYPLLLSAGASLFGAGVWSARLTTAFIGTLSLALAYWATLQVFYERPKAQRHLIALFSTLFLGLALGHITLSRAIYRGILQPAIMFLALGLLIRATRQNSWRGFAYAGASYAFGIYSYTAYFFVPLALFPYALWALLNNRHGSIKRLITGFILAAGVAGIVLVPVALRFLQEPQAVIGRSSAIAESTLQLNPIASTQGMLNQLLVAGDENPQYNVALAPLIAPLFAPFFIVGLLAQLGRLKHASTPYLFALLILCSLPAVLSDELTHNLRIVGLYAVVPLFIASACALWLSLAYRLMPHRQHLVWIVSLLCAYGILALETQRVLHVYNDYWRNADQWQMWRVYDQTLNHNEWFFRTDRRELAQWIEAQEVPLLVPIEELNRPTTLAWLLRSIHSIESITEPITLPENTQLVAPYSLERGNFIHASHTAYALVWQNRVQLLPPSQIDEAGFNDAQMLTSSTRLPALLSYTQASSVDIQFYPLPTPEWTYANEIKVGARLEGTQLVTAWQAQKRLGHNYFMTLQQTDAQYHTLALSPDEQILRWLYPTTRWQSDQIIPLSLPIPETWSWVTGLNRLALGIYPIFRERVQIEGNNADASTRLATLAQVTIPQSVSLPTSALPLELAFEQGFRLHALNITPDAQGWRIQCYWSRETAETPAPSAVIFIHLLATDGTIIAQDDFHPISINLPTSAWGEDLIETSHYLANQQGLSADMLRLRLGMYTLPDGLQALNIPLADGTPFYESTLTIAEWLNR